MRYIISGSLLLVLAVGSGAVLAGGMDHAAMQGKPAAAAVQGHKGEGVVNGIDLRQGKVNLTHGPIRTLGWSGMTMDFQVRDTAILKGIKPGQKVEFEVVNEGPGRYYIVRIAPSH